MSEILLNFQIILCGLAFALGCWGVYDAIKRFSAGDYSAFRGFFPAYLVCLLFGGFGTLIFVGSLVV